MSAIKAIIFDCFGVLYPNYVDEFFKNHKHFLSTHMVFLDKLNSKIDLGEITQTEFYEQLEKAMGIPADKIQFDMESKLVADKKLIQLIKQLKKKYKIGLLSNAGSEEISIIYRDGLDKLFNAITISYEVGDSKPNSTIYTMCLTKLGVSPMESIFVDDSTANLEAAHRLGLQTIHYPNFGTIAENLAELTVDKADAAQSALS